MLQPPQSVQLAQDPYAVSRTGFNEVLGYFKEQRALRQNAKLMAEQVAQKERALGLEYDYRLRNEMAIESIKGQAAQITAQQTAQQTAGIKAAELFGKATEQARGMVKDYVTRASGYSKVFSYNLAPVPMFQPTVDSETFIPGVVGTASMQELDESGNPVFKTIEYDQENIEKVFAELELFKPVAKLLDDFYDSGVPKPEKTEKYGDFTIVGSDTEGNELMALLRSSNPNKYTDPVFRDVLKRAMDGKIIIKQSDLAKEKFDVELVSERTRAETELAKVMKTLESKDGIVNFQSTTGWWVGRGAKADFNQPIEKVIETLNNTKDNFLTIDGLSDENIQQIRALHSVLLDITRIYRQQKNPTRPESVDMSDVYFDYKNNTLTVRSPQSAAGSTPQNKEAGIIEKTNIMSITD